MGREEKSAHLPAKDRQPAQSGTADPCLAHGHRRPGAARAQLELDCRRRLSGHRLLGFNEARKARILEERLFAALRADHELVHQLTELLERTHAALAFYQQALAQLDAIVAMIDTDIGPSEQPAI